MSVRVRVGVVDCLASVLNETEEDVDVEIPVLIVCVVELRVGDVITRGVRVLEIEVEADVDLRVLRVFVVEITGQL